MTGMKWERTQIDETIKTNKIQTAWQMKRLD